MILDEALGHIKIINWLMENGLNFKESLSLLNFAIKSGKTLPEAWLELYSDVSDNSG